MTAQEKQKTDRSRIQDKEKGGDYNPDLVLIGFDVNDHIDSIEPFDTVYKGFLIERDSLALPFMKTRLFIYKSLQSVYIASKIIKSAKNRVIKTEKTKTLLDKELRKDYKNHAYEITGKLLAEMNELCRQRGIELCIIFIPHRSQVHPDKFKPPMISYYFNDLDVFMEEECKKNGIPYINLLPPFKYSAEKGEQLYFNVDGHWNSNGHKLAAGLIFEKLRESGIIN